MALPDLDDLIAEVDRTCATATNDARSQPHWLELLKTAAAVATELQRLGDDLVEEYLEHCRLNGASWADIGDVLGVTRQAVQQRFQSPHREYQLEEISEELTDAMAAMKRIAVRQRNNYIGTEHLLWGLLEGENTATEALGALGVAVGDLRSKLERRLTLGASQAANRIAWTPYSRRAMATARDIATEQERAAVQCVDLLVGLLRLSRGVAASVLRESGVTADAVTSSVVAR